MREEIDPVAPAASDPLYNLEFKGTSVFESFKSTLESLFGREWLASRGRPHHLARNQWDLCNRQLASGGRLQIPENASDVPGIGRLLIDAVMLSAVTEGDLTTLGLGSLGVLGSPEKEKAVASRLADPHQYEDLLVELAFAGWNKIQKHKVELFERPVFPDMRIGVPGEGLPIYAECKRIVGSGHSRLEKELTSANAQLRGAQEPSYKIAVFDASSRGPERSRKLVGIPPRIHGLAQRAGRALNPTTRRSVGGVILCWDDYVLARVVRSNFYVSARRNSILVEHQRTPEVIVPPAHLPLGYGFGVEYFLMES